MDSLNRTINNAPFSKFQLPKKSAEQNNSSNTVLSDNDNVNQSQPKSEIENNNVIKYTAIALGTLTAMSLLGYAGYKGKLGKFIQKSLGGTKNKSKNIVDNPVNTPEGSKPIGEPISNPEVKNPVEDMRTNDSDAAVIDVIPLNSEDLSKYVQNRIKAILKLKDDGHLKIYKENPRLFYSAIREELYDSIRHCPEGTFSLHSGCEQNIHEVTKRSTKEIFVSPQNGWHYRFSRKHTDFREPVIDRISLNVYPEAELIKKLDKFISKSGINVEYKTSVNINKWQNRYDPITMYFREPITKEIEDEIVKLVSPHVRHIDKEVMIGKKLSDGIYRVKEPTAEDVEELINRAKSMDFDDELVKYLESPTYPYESSVFYKLDDDDNKIVHTSPGIVESVKQLLDKLEAIK